MDETGKRARQGPPPFGVPESREVLETALHDSSLKGWCENSDNPTLPGLTYWWAKAGDMYLGVLPERYASDRYRWFVGQGRRGEADNQPMMLAEGEADTPQAAREAATMFYNEHRFLPRRD